MRIGIIGTGTIASAVVRGIARDGHQITVSERSTRHSAALALEFANILVADNQTVIDQSDVVFLGLMGGSAEGILSDLTFRKDQRVVSFMAGLSLANVAKMVAPALASAIMLPFPTIAVGGSAILMLGDKGLVSEIFGATNHVFALKDDAELDAYLCAQAVLSPISRLVSDTANWLGERVENRVAGEEFLRVLVSSSLAHSESRALIEALNTEGGYNQRLRLYMEDKGMSADLTHGLNGLEKGSLK